MYVCDVSVYMIFAIYISLVFSRNFKVFFRRNLINDIVIRTLREFDELSFKIISVGLFPRSLNVKYTSF